MSRVFIAILLLLSGCSHSYFVQDKNDPHYYSGGSRIFPLNFLGLVKTVSNDSDNVTKSKPTEQFLPGSQVTESAAAGVLASGISLLINKDYYASPYISGTCLCSSVKDSVIELPCSNLTLILKDGSGKEIQRIHTQDGDFVFPVEGQKEYSVSVESSTYQRIGEVQSPLYLGDKVLIHLIPVPNQKVVLAQ